MASPEDSIFLISDQISEKILFLEHSSLEFTFTTLELPE